LTGNNSTPVTLNTSTPRASDACFAGASPLTLSSSSVVGGSNVTFTATLQAPHTSYAIVNLQQLGALIAQSLQENARAAFEVSSSPGNGTRVTIIFKRSATTGEASADQVA